MAAKIDRNSRNKLIALIGFLVLLLILIIVLGVRDITGAEARPAYESEPPPALREIGSVSIVDPDRIATPSTISDDDFIAFQRQARADFRTLGALSDDPATLSALGLSGTDAARIAAQLAYGRAAVPANAQGTLDGVAIDAATPTGGTATVQASYRSAALDGETVNITFSLAYQRTAAGLALSDVTVERG